MSSPAKRNDEKEESTSPPLAEADAVPARSTAVAFSSQETDNGANKTEANDQKRTARHAGSDSFEERINAKASHSDIRAEKKGASDKLVSSSTASAIDSFEERLKAKLNSSAASTKSGSVKDKIGDSLMISTRAEIELDTEPHSNIATPLGRDEDEPQIDGNFIADSSALVINQRPRVQEQDESLPIVPEAYLVEEGDGEIIISGHAEPVGCLERKWKKIVLVMCVFSVLMAVLLAVFLSGDRQEAETMKNDDTVVGLSGYMPLTRTDDSYEWRMCMGGECPLGNLFTDALRWSSQTDFAVLSSGGVRGPGWPAGEVRVSDLWDAYPFINKKCTGVMSGVSVFRLLNYSTAVATFESTRTEMGDRLLQMSGMQMSYNTHVNGTGSGRLMSVDIWDKDAQEYLPMERLKLYKFATTSWECEYFEPFSSLFVDLQMEGEVPGSVNESIDTQCIVGSYLSELNSSYNTSLGGSHVNDTEAFEPLAFIQTADSCLADEYWDAAIQTCKLWTRIF